MAVIRYCGCTLHFGVGIGEQRVAHLHVHKNDNLPRGWGKGKRKLTITLAKRARTISRDTKKKKREKTLSAGIMQSFGCRTPPLLDVEACLSSSSPTGAMSSVRRHRSTVTAGNNWVAKAAAFWFLFISSLASFSARLQQVVLLVKARIVPLRQETRRMSPNRRRPRKRHSGIDLHSTVNIASGKAAAAKTAATAASPVVPPSPPPEGTEIVHRRVSSLDPETITACDLDEAHVRLSPGELVDNKKSVVVNLLGGGAFSAVYLVQDTRSHRFAAIKVCKADRQCVDAASEEYRVCKEIAAAISPRHLGLVQRCFSLRSCGQPTIALHMDVFGPSLLPLIASRYAFLRTAARDRKATKSWLAVLKHVASCTLEALAELHQEMGDVEPFIHCDIKPENVLFRTASQQVLEKMHASPEVIAAASRRYHVGSQTLHPSDISLLYDCVVIDFGTARRASSVVNQSASGDSVSSLPTPSGYSLQTREYRSPELLYQLRPLHRVVTPAMDIWSFGCLVFELVTGTYLFDPKRSTDGVDVGKETDFAHAEAIACVLGEPPLFFRREGAPLLQRRPAMGPAGSPATLLKRRLLDGTDLSSRDADELADFLLCSLQYDPQNRKTALGLLTHAWLRHK